MQNTNNLTGCVVEVGSWRGVTTAYLANHTADTVVAIDPWTGDKNELNMRSFLARTASCGNVVYQRKPFGHAVRDWTHGPVRFMFIDAAHDYLAFAGCRRAVYESAEYYELAAHVPNLVLLRIPLHQSEAGALGYKVATQEGQSSSWVING